MPFAFGLYFCFIQGGSNKQSNVFRETRRLPPPTTLSRHTTHDSRRQRRWDDSRCMQRSAIAFQLGQQSFKNWTQPKSNCKKRLLRWVSHERERNWVSVRENVNTKSSKTPYCQRLRLWIVRSLSLLTALTCSLTWAQLFASLRFHKARGTYVLKQTLNMNSQWFQLQV